MAIVHPPRRAAVRSLALVAVAVGSLAACGSSSSSSSATSKASFDQQANAVCNQYTGQLNDLSNQIQSASSPAAKQQLLQRQINVFQSAEGKLSHLQKPPSEAPAISKAVGSLQTVIDDENAVLTAARTNDASGAQAAANKLQTDATQANSDFQTAGITACASTE